MYKKINKNKLGVIEYSIDREEDLNLIKIDNVDNTIYAIMNSEEKELIYLYSSYAKKWILINDTQEIDSINKQLDNKTDKTETQNIQQQVNNLVLGAVGDGNNAEVVQARGGEAVLNDRLNKFDKTIKIINDNINDMMFDEKISNPSFTIAVYDENYVLYDSTNRFASQPIYVKCGDKLTFNNNGDYKWKLTTFSSSEILNATTILEGYTYADFDAVNEYIVDNENCKTILIQGKPSSDKVLTDDDLNNFTESINIITNRIKEKPSYIRIGSYNIGHFNEGSSPYPYGSESKKIKFRKCIADMNCNIVALQENDIYYNDNTKESAYESVYRNFKYYSCGTKYDYNCNGFASDYRIDSPYEKIFINNYNQNRYYYCCDITIDDKDIHLISTQLEFQDVDTRRKQINEILEEVKKYERCIICGDFNVANRINGVASEPYNALYEEDYKLFTDQGLTLANVGYLGGINTLVGREGSSDGVFPWDNIIVTNNIKIKNIGRVEMEYMNDHYPIFADLVIY